MTIQEVVEKAFGANESMSKADLVTALENTGAKLADLSEGKYIDVNKHASELREKETAIKTDYETKLASANAALAAKEADFKKFEGIDPEAVKKHPDEVANLKKEYAVRESLLQNRVRDIPSALTHIDVSKVSFNQETKQYDGLNDQIETLVKDKPFLFETGTSAGIKSSGAKTTGTGNPSDQIDDNAIRKAMGLAPKK